MEDAKRMIVCLNQRNPVCKKKGHIAKVCRSKSFRNNRETNLVEDFYKLLSGDKQELYKINGVISSMEATMKIDTGASVSITNYNNHLKFKDFVSYINCYVTYVFGKCYESKRQV